MPSPADCLGTRLRVLVIVLTVLPGCAGGLRESLTTELPPTIQRVPVCSGHGCRTRDIVSFDEAEWRGVRALFEPRPRSAADERRQIAHAIALMEKRIGPKTGTEHDKGGTFPGLFQAGQMDCIDEATNTTVYLRLLAANGLMRLHDVGLDATRGYFLFGWPHTTATIREKTSGMEYAVDSWFFDNGVEPAILPLTQWQAGWSPRAGGP